ncbi:MAG: hypothetical protein WA421_07675 [Nitrososphaeraceae archaeon]
MDEPSNCSDLNKGSPYGAVIAQGLNCTNVNGMSTNTNTAVSVYPIPAVL